MTIEAKTKAKDLSFKAKTKAIPSEAKAKGNDITPKAKAMTSKAKSRSTPRSLDPRTMIICRNLVSYCYLVDVVAFSYSLYFHGAR